MKKILITGGPVHAYLDDVKIITNKFKGGLISNLADQICKQYEGKIEIIYLSSKTSIVPKNKSIKHIIHNGLYDYRDKVLELAPSMDGVVLGAAVVNLIPKNKIEGKFPSHNYKVGDTIPINFTIAPRIIDEVKKVSPNTCLFGFKLLSGVEKEELISAAYGVLLESKAVTVFANDAMNIMQKYAVTKERSVHQLSNEDLPSWIWERLNEQYYKTIRKEMGLVSVAESNEFFQLVKRYKSLFVKVKEGFVFGTIALRRENDSFFTTIRGKNESDGGTVVEEVDDEKKTVCVGFGLPKATLNAPLLNKIFKERKDVKYIVHYHGRFLSLPSVEYKTPGTVEDSLLRDVKKYPSFYIKGHGSILSFNEKGEIINEIPAL